MEIRIGLSRWAMPEPAQAIRPATPGTNNPSAATTSHGNLGGIAPNSLTVWNNTQTGMNPSVSRASRCAVVKSRSLQRAVGCVVHDGSFRSSITGRL